LSIVIAGLLGVGAALYLVSTNRDETWNLFLDITGLFGVPIAGIFALGIFTKRANTPGIWVGLFVAAVTAYFVQPTDLTPFAISTVDRKSTRLNSSHVSISYAVFCLKK